MSNVSKLIKEARTHRWFQERNVDPKDIKDVLEGARFSAYARNMQKIRYAVVNDDKTLVNAIFENTNLCSVHKVALNNQPAGYIVFAHNSSEVANKETHFINVGIVYQNINLLLEERGLRCVMVYSVNKPKTKELLNLADEYEVDLVVGYGYPLREVALADTDNEKEHPYYLNEQGVHTVPKLVLEKQILLKK